MGGLGPSGLRQHGWNSDKVWYGIVTWWVMSLYGSTIRVQNKVCLSYYCEMFGFFYFLFVVCCWKMVVARGQKHLVMEAGWCTCLVVLEAVNWICITARNCTSCFSVWKLKDVSLIIWFCFGVYVMGSFLIDVCVVFVCGVSVNMCTYCI